ncbi:nonsense-mediated mRNA decay factor SMG8 isoform X2 [Battus philenor]|uniref:nonsense-mediated mRNA decay factor SMG8 isoform X2 n=1 Tax=Battus philenor TaxID=42288 RepID=UPI0035CFFA76
MNVFSINDIPEFSKKERIVVVGIIGKSPYRYPNKTTPLLPSVKCEENDIECHWDERGGILYLHAMTYLDTKRLVALANDLNEDSKSSVKDADAAHWLVAAGELAMESCKAMTLIFHLCHIVILSLPTPVFDLGYLQLFEAVDAYRNELLLPTKAALTNAKIGGTWETHGRLCCPRLLFHFRRAPTPLRKAPAALKRLEHAVEDQLYFKLRKTRIITNVCAKSVFAIPKNEEFVYINTEEETGNARDVSSLVRGLVQLCRGEESEAPTERPSFRQFLQGHIDLAFGEGFDDNVGKYAMSTSFFELPSASSWRKAAQALAPIYLQTSKTEGEKEYSGVLFDTLATDVRFSQARCAKVLPIAQASYTEGLPPFYSSQQHAHKVNVALGELEAMARGPLIGGARTRLRAACAAVWKTRKLCEAPSLTQHPCIEPEHDSSKEHSSGVRYVSACNCGRHKSTREDPYTVRQANYGFYQQAADDCGVCNTLQSIDMPVFQPSTPSFRAASVKGANGEELSEAGEAQGASSAGWGGSSGEGEACEGSAWSPHALSPGSARDDDEAGDGAPSTATTAPATDRDRYDLVPLREEPATEKVMSRQPSTTEYLPGMLHTASPANLLPAFPSWSLVCLGPSSLYSHSLGLPEHLQPGFLPHTNYLFPWDCSVKSEQTNAWRSSRGRGKPTPQHPLTVKIFIGFEFECPRGHRFMMSSPEGGTGGGVGVPGGAGGATGGGWARDAAAGARLAHAAVPLQLPCLCRAAPRAHLARAHIVTPKSNVHVTLQPKVQPIPGGPIFIPHPVGEPPLKLSTSAYWVLRFPYVYCDERGVLPRPRPPAYTTGTLVPPLFGLQD